MVAYPNPFNNELSLEISGGYGPFNIQISDISGRIVYHVTYNEASKILLGSDFILGMYFIKVSDQQESNYFKLFKY